MAGSPFVDAHEVQSRTAQLAMLVGVSQQLAAALSVELHGELLVHSEPALREALEEGQRLSPTIYVVAQAVLEDPQWDRFRKLIEQRSVPVVLVLRDRAASQTVPVVGAAGWSVVSSSAEGIAARLKSILQDQTRNGGEALLQAARWKFALEGASLGVWEHDLRAGLISLSPALCRSLGLSSSQASVSQQVWSSWIHPQDQERVADARRRLCSGQVGEVQLEYRLVGPGQRIVWIRETARILYHDQGRPAVMMGVVTDTTQQRASERRIVKLANFDLLTDLPNRKKCCEFLLEAFERARTIGGAACLFRIDISGLAAVNQSLGRQAGDQVLQQVATRLRDYVSEPECVCRLGGKEFAFIIEGIERSGARARAAEVAAQVVEKISEPFEVWGEGTSCAVHLGVCIFPEGGSDPEDLIRKAEIALAEAKHERFPFAVFRKTMLARVEERQLMLHELRCAVFTDEIDLSYQPIVERSGALVGVEALARWQHPTRGRFPAAEFIPLAIQSGLIVPLGAALRRKACQQLSAWARHPQLSKLVMSVNVSPSEFWTDSFSSDLLLLMKSLEVDPCRLQLELSEALLQGDPTALERKLGALSEAGIRLALDDFGTGHSSLTLLKKLPFVQLKLDRSLVGDILTDPVDASLSRAIVAIAQNLGLEVVAEGVEEESQVKLLGEMGCTRFQGYLFGRPTDARTIEARATSNQPIVPLVLRGGVMSMPPIEGGEEELGASILVVDDDPTTLQLLARILRDYPNVRTTNSPLEALRLAQERPPDLLLLDTQMPELDGFELLESLRRVPAMADVPAVFVTALLDPETEIRALSMGAADFVSKPISAARLKLAVRNQVRLKRQTDSLRQQASVDPLTNVANRRSFDRAMEREIARAVEGSSPISLLMVDVDKFKAINDECGHQAGDRCLMSIARILTGVVRRPVDLVARYGGEEFGVVLPLADVEFAEMTAQAIVKQVAETRFSEELEDDRLVTVSVGWATLSGENARELGAPARELVRRADDALFLAKEGGRNRACGPNDLMRRTARGE